MFFLRTWRVISVWVYMKKEANIYFQISNIITSIILWSTSNIWSPLISCVIKNYRESWKKQQHQIEALNKNIGIFFSVFFSFKFLCFFFFFSSLYYSASIVYSYLLFSSLSFSSSFFFFFFVVFVSSPGLFLLLSLSYIYIPPPWVIIKYFPMSYIDPWTHTWLYNNIIVLPMCTKKK